MKEKSATTRKDAESSKECVKHALSDCGEVNGNFIDDLELRPCDEPMQIFIPIIVVCSLLVIAVIYRLCHRFVFHADTMSKEDASMTYDMTEWDNQRNVPKYQRNPYSFHASPANYHLQA
jgi:hypothetical protein